MLGSATEADDAVQEAWLRLNGSTTSEVANLGGWLTTVVARVCLDTLRSRRREEALDAEVVDSIADSKSDPEQETLLADSVGVALLVVLDTLSPAERVAFVLHDVFDLPFDEIAPIVDRKLRDEHRQPVRVVIRIDAAQKRARRSCRIVGRADDAGDRAGAADRLHCFSRRFPRTPFRRAHAGACAHRDSRRHCPARRCDDDRRRVQIVLRR